MNLLFRFNSDGSLKEYQSGNLIQSSVNANKLYVKVDNLDVSNYVAMVEYKRPDGKVSNDIAMTYEEIPYGLGYGFSQVIPAWCTQLDGQLEITIRLLRYNEDGDKEVFAMSKNVAKVLSSTSSGDGVVNITEEQYQHLIQNIITTQRNQDKLMSALTFNRIGLLKVSSYNEETGIVDFIFDPDIVKTFNYNEDTGILDLTY